MSPCTEASCHPAPRSACPPVCSPESWLGRANGEGACQTLGLLGRNVFTSNCPCASRSWASCSGVPCHSPQLAEQYGPVYSLHLGPHPIIVLHGHQAVKDALCGQAVSFGGRGRLPIMDNALRGYGMSPSRAAARPLLCGPQFCLFLWSMTFLRLGCWGCGRKLSYSTVAPSSPRHPNLPAFSLLAVPFMSCSTICGFLQGREVVGW